MTDIESTQQASSQPRALVARRWPTLAGLGFAALQRPAAAWPLFFVTAAVITVARLLDDRFEPTCVIVTVLE